MTATAKDGACKKSALEAIRARLVMPEFAGRIRLVLSGDTHVFQFFEPRDRSLPIQLVAGNGGTKLDELRPQKEPKPPGEPKDIERDAEVNSYGVSGSALTVKRHGFVKLLRDDSDWSVTLMSAGNELIAKCHFSVGRSQPPAKSPNCTE
jgi:hypothetical protein